jgi:hypothetical protein
MPIYVFTLVNGEHSKDRQVQIKPNTIKNIAITVDMKRKNMQSLNESQMIETDDRRKNNIEEEVSSIASQLVRIEFHEQSMRSIPRVNLDQSNNSMIHKVFVPD